MRGWWIVGLVGARNANVVASFSKEERHTVGAIALLGIVNFVTLMLVGNGVFHQTKIRDDLDIHLGIIFLASAVLSPLLARCIFVLLWPELSAQADANAEKRLKESDR